LPLVRKAAYAPALHIADAILFARRARMLHINPGLWRVAAGEGMTTEDLGYDVHCAVFKEWNLGLPEAAFQLLALARHHRSADCAVFLLAEIPEDAARLEVRAAAQDA
jgi:hypothetical protein